MLGIPQKRHEAAECNPCKLIRGARGRRLWADLKSHFRSAIEDGMRNRVGSFIALLIALVVVVLITFVPGWLRSAKARATGKERIESWGWNIAAMSLESIVPAW